MIRSIVIAALTLQCSLTGAAMAAETAPAVDASTNTVGLMLSAETVWPGWLATKYPLKGGLTKEQELALKPLSGSQWDERFVGALFNDGTPGVLLAKFSPSKKTLARLAVLRWSKNGWKPLLRCGQKKLVYAKAASITSTESIDVYEVYLQRQPEGLGFMITFGNAGDKLFGDAVSLSYDGRAQNYVEPDDSDHD